MFKMLTTSYFIANGETILKPIIALKIGFFLHVIGAFLLVVVSIVCWLDS